MGLTTEHDGRLPITMLHDRLPVSLRERDIHAVAAGRIEEAGGRYL